MPTILAMDTSTAACSVALWRDGGVAASRFEVIERGHAEYLVPMIEAVMAEADEQPADIDLIAVTTGPGAFTGIRLGLATARAMALAQDIPCIGILTTEALAAGVPQVEPTETILSVLDSKRGDVYAQAFDPTMNAVADPEALPPDGVPSYLADHAGEGRLCVLAGDVQPAVAAVLSAERWAVRQTGVVAPDAAVVAGLAAARWRPGDRLAPPAPLYLRPPDAVVPANGGRLRG